MCYTVDVARYYVSILAAPEMCGKRNFTQHELHTA